MTTIKAILSTGKEFGKLRFRLLDGRGKQLYYKSGIIVRASIWDAKGGRVSPRKVCDQNERRRVNVAVAGVTERLLSVYESNKARISTSADLARFMDGGETPTGNTLGELWRRFLASKEGRASETRRWYSHVMGVFMRFAECEERERGKGASSLHAETFSVDDFTRFARYAADEWATLHKHPDLAESAGRVKQCGRGANSVSQLVLGVKTFFHWCNRAGVTGNAPQRSYSPQRQVFAEPFYLTREERDALAACDLSEPLAQMRDVFIFQCYVGCRAGDLLRLTRDNIRGGFLEYVPQKTKRAGIVAKSVRVPLHPVAAGILERYGGLLPFPRTRNAYNTAIRAALRAAGITRKVQVIDRATHELTQKPLCDVASSHTARKTFVGILYEQVKDPNLICALSGHVQGSKAFLRYRTINDKTNEDTIKLL